MFMLACPFTFYAVNGVRKLLNQAKARQHSFELRKLRRRVVVMFLCTVSLGGIYLATPFLMVNAGFGIYSLWPICRYFGSAPTVPYQDIDGTVQAVHWLKDHMENDSCAVLHSAFASWARLYLEESQNIVAYINDVDSALNRVMQNDYEHVYFICWNESISWYGVYVPESFIELERFDRISVFQYVG